MREILPIPAEYEMFGTYFPPVLLAFLLACVAMVLTVKVFNRYRLGRFFMAPNLVMLAMVIIYTFLFGTFLFPS